MTDHQDNHNHIDPSLLDTQHLLLGAEIPEDAAFSLDDILAEYGTAQVPEPVPSQEEPPAPPPVPEPESPAPVQEPDPEPAPEPEPESPQPRRRGLFRRARQSSDPAAPPPEPEPRPEAPGPLPEEEPAAPKIRLLPKPDASGPSGAPDPDDLNEAMLDMAFWDEFAVTEGLYFDETRKPSSGPLPPSPPPITFAPLQRSRGQEPEKASPDGPEPEPVPDPEPESAEPAISMEDVVASTVDAVKEEQEKKQEKFRERLERFRKQSQTKAARRREAASRHTLPEIENEPPAMETASRHKRRFRECRRSLTGAVLLLILLWTPWVLEQANIAVPFFSDSADNAGLCVLVGQAIICILCWPVYRTAVRSLQDGAWTVHATALLTTLVTLFDEMTMLVLPERTAAAPLGGIAAALSVFSLWGLTGWHRGMAETFRMAAMGEPMQVAECGLQGITRGHGTGAGFYTRAAMEDSSTQWQRLLLPVLALASLIFSVLSSIGQQRGQDFLWCWSVVLCASSSLVFPMSFGVPFGRVAAHLARSGAAAAGMYGAAAFASDKRFTVTDTDLFPPGSARLAGIKLYGEEQNHALSYAATLAVQGGGVLGRLFRDACRNTHVSYQKLEHFHIHEDGGLGGMIHGETVLAGSPAFMRRQGVRLPPSLTSKTAFCLAVDGELTAVFTVKYASAEPVEYALKILQRNGYHLVLATRDGNLNPRFLKARFGSCAGAETLELDERLALSDPEREADGAEGLLYRDGILPYAFLAVDSRRLCQTVRVGNILSVFSSIAGALLGFYLTFTGSYSVLTPILLATYAFLWVLPMLPMVLTVDKG